MKVCFILRQRQIQATTVKTTSSIQIPHLVPKITHYSPVYVFVVEISDICCYKHEKDKGVLTFWIFEIC